MANFTKQLLSASNSGRNLLINQPTAPGVTLHTAQTTPTATDEVWLYVANNGTNALPVTVCWGTTTAADQFTYNVLGQSGRNLIVDGKLIQAGLSVSAFCSTGTVVMDGFVNRYQIDVDPVVQDWVNRVVFNGGATPSLNTQQALTAFVLGMRASGLLAKMVMVNCFVPDGLVAAMTPLIMGAGFETWINHNFVAGDVTINGITGDGSTKYADTGMLATTAFNGVGTSLGLTVYCFTNPSSWTGNQEDLLAYDGGTNQLAILTTFNASAYFDVFSETVNSGRVTALNSAFRGYFSGNYGTLDGSIKQAIYVGNPLSGGHKTLVSSTGATNGGTITTNRIFFATGDQTGSPVATSYSNKTYSFAAAHFGLKSAESQTLYSLIQSMRVSLGGGYVSSDPVSDWANRVVFNGGATPSVTTLSALSTFYATLVSTGLINKMYVINIVAPDSLTAALTPFWNVNGAGGNDPWINHSFVGGDLTVNGLIGNGSSKYLDSGIVPANTFLSDSNGGVTVYTTVNTVNVSDADFYCAQAVGQAMGLLVNQGSGGAGSSFLDCYSQTAGSGRISASNPTWTGYLSGNAGVLDGSIIAAIYKASSSVAHTTLVSSTTSTGGTRPTIPMFAFADNNIGSPALFTNKRYSFFATHAGLLSAESQNFYNAIQALRTALGGGFV